METEMHRMKPETLDYVETGIKVLGVVMLLAFAARIAPAVAAVFGFVFDVLLWLYVANGILASVLLCWMSWLAVRGQLGQTGARRGIAYAGICGIGVIATMALKALFGV